MPRPQSSSALAAAEHHHYPRLKLSVFLRQDRPHGETTTLTAALLAARRYPDTTHTD